MPLRTKEKSLEKKLNQSAIFSPSFGLKYAKCGRLRRDIHRKEGLLNQRITSFPSTRFPNLVLDTWPASLLAHIHRTNNYHISQNEVLLHICAILDFSPLHLHVLDYLLLISAWLFPPSAWLFPRFG